MDWTSLIEHAWATRDLAYAPYSKFHVGAAVLSVDGRIFEGCNVENLSYGLTICAERVAIGSAVASGVRRISRVVVAAETTEPISPCGACRQVMAEFGVEELLLVNRTHQVRFLLEEIFPRASTGILDRG